MHAMEEPRDVFVSYSSEDRPMVEAILFGLVQQGIRPWFDAWEILGGDAFIAKISTALELVPAIAVFIGPNTIHPWQHAEVERAVKLNIESGGAKRVIPVLISGATTAKIPPFLDLYSAISFPSTTDAEALRLLKWSIQGRVAPGPDPARMPFSGERPYRGLDAFDVGDVRFFAGRSGTVKRLVSGVGELLDGANPKLLGIVGDSGSGKSSLARAGLIPALLDGALERAPSWKYLVVKPGSSPIQSLVLAFSNADGKSSDPRAVLDLKKNLESDPANLSLIAAAFAGSGRLVLLADQFEETFSLCRDETERRLFIDALMHACAAPDSRTFVLLTLRADFYGTCAEHDYSGFAGALNRQHLLVGPMNAEELQQAIRDPAVRAGYEVEDALVEILVHDALDQRGALPLLQFTLDELWRRRTGRTLTLDSYRKMNGLSGALNEQADKLYGSLTPDQQAIVRRILLRLVQIGDDGRLLRNRVSLPQLLPRREDSERAKAVRDLLDRLASRDYRLVTITAAINGDGSPGAEPAYVEVTHEALIRNWKQLRGWLEDKQNREFLLWRQSFLVMLVVWREANHDGTAHLRGPMLARALHWIRDRPDDFSPEESEFIDASRATATEEEREQLHRRAIVWALGIAVAVAAVALIFLIVYRPRVDRRVNIARGLLDTNPYLATLVALRADASHSTAETTSLLEQALQASTEAPIEHGSEITSLALSGDGQRIASGAEDGSVCVWQLDGRRVFCTPPLDGAVAALAFIHSNQRIAAVARTGTRGSWSASNGGAPSTTASAQYVAAASVGQDGTAALVIGNRACLWPSHAPTPGPCFDAIPDVLAVAIDTTAGLMAVVGNGTRGVIIKYAAAGRSGEIDTPGGVVRSAVFNRSGTRLLTAAEVGPVQLWDPEAAKRIGDPIRPGAQNVLLATLNAAGDTIGSVNADGSVALYDVGRGETPLVIPGSNKRAAALAMDPDTARLAVALPAGKVRIYDFVPANLRRRACKAEKRFKTGLEARYMAECKNNLDKAQCEADCDQLPGVANSR